MTPSPRTTRVIEGVPPDAIPYGDLLTDERPAVLKGVVRDWPLARAASPAEAAGYLKSFYQGRPVLAFIARPELKGRFGYTQDATRLDFISERGPLTDYLDTILGLPEDGSLDQPRQVAEHHLLVFFGKHRGEGRLPDNITIEDPAPAV